MQTQASSALSPDEIKRQLETIAGHEIDASPEQLKNLTYPAGSYAYFAADEESAVTWRGLIFPIKYCNSATLLDTCGASITGVDGKRVFRLSEFVCFSTPHDLLEPINIVATARSEGPFFLTMTYALIDSASDLQITVFAWDVNGAPAANIVFDWRCRVAWEPHIL
jgi:hypothetical protein